MSTAGQARPAFLAYHFLWEMLDWIFPPACGGCQANGVRWCASCQQKVSLISGPICPCCGDPQADGKLCPACRQSPPGYDRLRSFAAFTGPLREALHRLKYRRDIGLAEALSKHLIELYNLENWTVNLVVPVPLGRQRMRQRGYNQSVLLGMPLAYAIQVPFSSTVLFKNRETRTQVGLSANQRAENVAGAFTCKPNRVRGKSVLVVDDVTTTGSTISACAQALREAGASAVYGLTLARAVLQADADDQPKTIS